MPSFSGQLSDQADRGRRRLRRPGHARLILPPDFPAEVEAFATDLDRTLIAEDAELRPRTLRAIAAARAAGIRVILVTGRMFRSVRPYAEAAGIEEPVVCYQGAVVAEPVSGEWLRHEPIPLELAREAIAAVEAEGYPSTATSTTSSTSPSTRRRRRRTRPSRTSRCTRSATCSPGCPSRRRSSSPSATRSSSTGCRAAAEEALRRAAVHLEVAAALPRVREPGGDEGLGPRVRRRAPRLLARSGRSRSATARTTSSCSSGPATRSRSRTRTSA